MSYLTKFRMPGYNRRQAVCAPVQTGAGGRRCGDIISPIPLVNEL